MDLYCDRIPDRQLENAVVHALTLMRQGYRPNIANAEAARAYGYATSDVSHYTGQHASRIRAARKSGGRAGNPAAPGSRKGGEKTVRLDSYMVAGIAYGLPQEIRDIIFQECRNKTKRDELMLKLAAILRESDHEVTTANKVDVRIETDDDSAERTIVVRVWLKGDSIYFAQFDWWLRVCIERAAYWVQKRDQDEADWADWARKRGLDRGR